MNQLKIQDNLAISDSGFLFFPTTGETFTLNELGKQIIQGLHDGKDSEKIIEQIMEKFDADRETVDKNDKIRWIEFGRDMISMGSSIQDVKKKMNESKLPDDFVKIVVKKLRKN